MGDTPESRAWTTAVIVLCYVWMEITVNITQSQPRPSAPRSSHFVDSGFNLCLSSALVLPTSTSHLHGDANHRHACRDLLGCAFVKEMPTTPIVKSATSRLPHKAFKAVYTSLRTLPRVLTVSCLIFLLAQYGFTVYNGTKGQFFGVTVKSGEANDADTCTTPHHRSCTPSLNAI
ncbi:Aste57867_4457 [Aphanomyces stellatus]|uniref:Aste57867_4457 protein n=1 Tax=Aphanomyces stellatus TaxID=120398 RepID=A0A485KCU5_9STRA|nr:hypothetical protein As57867_004445 [Aphanomyces stellatus]VFT81568.1 Aste57867_4457 [Aphanomyces stellatus]